MRSVLGASIEMNMGFDFDNIKRMRSVFGASIEILHKKEVYWERCASFLGRVLK